VATPTVVASGSWTISGTATITDIDGSVDTIARNGVIALNFLQGGEIADLSNIGDVTLLSGTWTGSDPANTTVTLNYEYNDGDGDSGPATETFTISSTGDGVSTLSNGVEKDTYTDETISGTWAGTGTDTLAQTTPTYLATATSWDQVGANNSLTASGEPPAGSTGYMGTPPPGYTGTVAPSGSETLSGNVGALIIGGGGTWTLGGTATIAAVTDTGFTVTLAAGSNNLTVGSVTLNGTASVQVSSADDVAFTAPSETLKLAMGNSSTPLDLTVSGMQAATAAQKGDIIDFTNLPDLTLGYGYTIQTVSNQNYSVPVPTDTATLYSGNVPVATLTVEAGTGVTNLEPISDGHGGTEVIVDPGSPTIVNPAADPLVNWGYIQANEGGIWNFPYIIPNKGGGATVGSGVDLGAGPAAVSTQAGFATTFNQYVFTTATVASTGLVADVDPNLNLLYDYFVGVQNVVAQTNATGKVTVFPNPAASNAFSSVTNGETGQAVGYTVVGNQTLISDSLDSAQVATVIGAAELAILTTATTDYASNNPVTPFASLPAQVQTALVDLYYNLRPTTIEQKGGASFYGAVLNYTSSNLATLDTMYYALLVWAAAASKNSSPLSMRLFGDANLIATAMTTPPSPPTLATQTPNTTNPALTNVSANVTSTLQHVVVDPSGESSYTLLANSGSPLFASIQLPDGDPTASDTPAAYSVSYDVNGTWSSPQTEQPLQTLTLPANVEGLKVTTLDATGNPYVSTSDFVFIVTFASTGHFTGTMTAGTSVALTPTPPWLPTLGTPNNFSVTDQSGHFAGGSWQCAGTPYSGPVSGLTSEFIAVTTDNINVTATVPNTFISLDGGGGEDAIAVNQVNGNNVLNGSTGSSFLYGGTGNDTFFVDDRNPPTGSSIWSTVVGFHSGDNATVWGVTPNDFNLSWVNGQGATGFTGVTLHATGSGKPTASLTLAGLTSANLSNGTLAISYGTTPSLPNLPGSDYMLIHYN
jgi:hypothetical protein